MYLLNVCPCSPHRPSNGRNKSSGEREKKKKKKETTRCAQLYLRRIIIYEHYNVLFEK